MIERENVNNMVKDSELELMNDRKIAPIFEDVKINVKIILAALWAGHFLLWTFGDMASLLQQLNDPVANNLLLFVAVPTAMAQALMIFISLTGKPKMARTANIGVASVFLLLNVGFISEATAPWQALLGVTYLLFTVLIIKYAWKWPKQEYSSRGGN